jgi:membrane-bound inhibitor of C-type lysozyme
MTQARLSAAAAALLAAAGCGGASLWPFGEGAPERERAPADARAYTCEGGRRLWVRTLEGGAAVWVILPEREIRLEKTGAAAGTSYGYRGTLLELKGDEAALYEGANALLARCKAAAG